MTLIQLSGILKGDEPVARSNARPRWVNGSTGVPFSTHPCTVPVVEPQRERSVGVDMGAIAPRIAQRRSFPMPPTIGASTSSSKILRMQRESPSIERASSIMGSSDCIDDGFAAFPELFAHRGIVELRFSHQPRRQRVGRFLGEQAADQRVVRAEPLAHALQRERQRQRLDFGIDGHSARRAAARCAAALRR